MTQINVLISCVVHTRYDDLDEMFTILTIRHLIPSFQMPFLIG